MAETLNDVDMDGTWLDIYTITGLTIGTSLVIKNKSSSTPLIQVTIAQPTQSSMSGWDLSVTEPGSWTTVRNIPVGNKVWVKGSGPLFVQAYE